jgi:hypothetical protein
MPLVEARCRDHGDYEALVLRRDQAVCPTCGKDGKTVFNSPATYRMDFRSGWSSGAGKYFDTKRQRENWMVKTGSRRVKD